METLGPPGLLILEGDHPLEGSTSCLVSGVESLLLASLLASISESSSDSAELDSSSDSSLFPNKTLSGLGERSKEQSLLVSLDSIGSSGKESIFFLRSLRISCLQGYPNHDYPISVKGKLVK